MALAGFYAGKIMDCSKPARVMAVSRCYRAETSGLQEEKGIFRVHNFSKVELFSVCKPDQSDEVLESFKNIEIELFKRLGLHFKLLDMPPCELGAPAYRCIYETSNYQNNIEFFFLILRYFRKYDIEAWMSGRDMYGEISSCSNCTDYQSKRLNIRCLRENGESVLAHTVNGTACAVPRMLIAILENNQVNCIKANSTHFI